ncbi:hypothetical protein CGLAMM_11430 [Acetobacteraceae bacterium EV16G]|uniref:hypothetical protein n=1 Tax=Sorlinia euscelidii TaxID=3081148 RepID=UPI002F3763B1
MTGHLTVSVTYSGGRIVSKQYDGGLVKQMGPYQQIGSITGPYDIASRGVVKHRIATIEGAIS